MSLINDALKQARQAPPRNPPGGLPPLPPAADESPVLAWLLPAIVILLIVAAIFFIGWAVARHTVRTNMAAPEPAPAAPAAAVVTAPVVVQPAPAPAAPPVNPPAAPKLHGIFYSPTAPSAIVDNQTVRPGDVYRGYRVKTISKYTVTLVGPDQKEIQIGMDN